MPQTGLTAFVAASVLVGIGLGVVVSGALRSIAIDEAPPALRGTAQGLINIFNAVGTLLAVTCISAIADFEDRPDNVFLLTDGLPTQGKTPPSKYMVSGQQRRKHFNAAMDEFPKGVPINTILFPMEGDPEAAALFWQTALDTKGAFIAPSRDWP